MLRSGITVHEYMHQHIHIHSTYTSTHNSCNLSGLVNIDGGGFKLESIIKCLPPISHFYGALGISAFNK